MEVIPRQLKPQNKKRRVNTRDLEKISYAIHTIAICHSESELVHITIGSIGNAIFSFTNHFISISIQLLL